MMERDGFEVFEHDPDVARWAQAAYDQTINLLSDPKVLDQQLRHQRTWFVGVDTLHNDQDGRVNDTPLSGPWTLPKLSLHRAQISIVYPGYPMKDRDESEANHRYRTRRRAAHVDGLLPIGGNKRRYAKEPHAYILGLPLNAVSAAPTVVWKGSHHILKQALSAAIGDHDPTGVDITEAYHQARQEVFNTCEMIAINCAPGQSFVLDRFALHGTEPWAASIPPEKDGRIIAFFRPEFPNPKDWLTA